MYLDRLDRQPVQWGVFPRLQVWSMEQISRDVKADRMLNGDFGVVGTLDVAYGENHPRLARDTDGPQEQDEGLCVRMVSKWKNRTPRRMSNRKNLRQYWPRVIGHGTTYVDILKSSANDASVVVVELVGFKKEQLRRWMYVAGVFAHKLVSDAVLRFSSKSCWCLAKYPFCLLFTSMKGCPLC